MQKPQIIESLKKHHSSFTTYVQSLSDEDFVFSYPGKWTAGQQLQHICLAVRPVVLAFSLPKILVRTFFGKASTTGRSYEELIATYVNKLNHGAKASRPYIPGSVKPTQKAELITGLNARVESLCMKLEKFSEQELDSLRLPHPILGKLTLREMLYFTMYHVGHHEGAVRRSLKQRVTTTNSL